VCNGQRPRVSHFGHYFGRHPANAHERQELNPQASCPNELPANDLEKIPRPPTAFWDCAKSGNCHCLAASGTPEFLLHSWPRLPPHVKETIFTLFDAALSRLQGA